jgi:hypothetical protein
MWGKMLASSIRGPAGPSPVGALIQNYSTYPGSCKSRDDSIGQEARSYFDSLAAGGELSISHWARLLASVIAVFSVAKMTFRSRGVHA